MNSTEQIIYLYEEVRAMVLEYIEGNVEHEDTLCLWFYIEDDELHITYCDTDEPNENEGQYELDRLVDVDLETGLFYPDMAPISAIVEKWYPYYRAE